MFSLSLCCPCLSSVCLSVCLSLYYSLAHSFLCTLSLCPLPLFFPLSVSHSLALSFSRFALSVLVRLPVCHRLCLSVCSSSIPVSPLSVSLLFLYPYRSSVYFLLFLCPYLSSICPSLSFSLSASLPSLSVCGLPAFPVGITGCAVRFLASANLFLHKKDEPGGEVGGGVGGTKSVLTHIRTRANTHHRLTRARTRARTHTHARTY